MISTTSGCYGVNYKNAELDHLPSACIVESYIRAAAVVVALILKLCPALLCQYGEIGKQCSSYWAYVTV